MGQQASKEEARLDELHHLTLQLHDLLNILGPRASAEKAAGFPAAPGSDQVLYDDAFDTLKRMYAEKKAIVERQRARAEGRSLPMPTRTPPFRQQRRLRQKKRSRLLRAVWSLSHRD
ncbi:glycosyl transferase [Micractinium conductrix]|uniref:Glycosyl transferase n=1 Tax=Micractinium conductrix TaxID=554055 RepID=A0A2P6V2L9_9CHLO|nr:glycosyl transferase [Micractinium conductrix]|eukprot:PSC68337.1 glycosyl transferase [Micractinium conductrix]